MQEPIFQTVETQLEESRLAYPGWKIVLAGFFGVMVSFAAIVPYTFGLFLKPLAQSFGWHREATSAGFSIAALTLAAASPGLGFLLDRYKPRRIILPCIVIFSAAYASLALLTPHLLHFYLTFFLIGMVGNGTAYIGYSRAISTWFNRRRGFALSIMLAGSAVGAMLLPVLAQAVITHAGVAHRLPCSRLARFCAGLSPDRGICPRTPCCSPEPGRLHRTGRTRCQGPCDPSLLDHCRNGLSLCHRREWSHRASLRLLTDRGVSAAGAAWSVAVIGATSLVGRLLTGIFLDRFFGPRVSQIMLLMTVLGIVLLSVANSLTAGLIAAALHRIQHGQ